MSSRFTTVLAAVGTSGALIAGGLAFGGSSANADDAMTTYTYNCGTPVGPYDVPVAFPTQLSTLPTSATTGEALPSFDIPTQLTVPKDLVNLLVGAYSTISGSATSSLGFGSQGIPVKTTLPSSPLVANQDTVITATGKTGSFTPSTAGTFDVMTPKTMDAMLQGIAVPCTLSGAPASLGQITVAQGSTTTPPPAAKPVITATAPKTAKAGKSVTVKVTVKNAKTGKVTAKLGKKAFSAPLKAGKASVVVKGIKKGVNKIVVSFPKAVSKTLKVTGK